MCHDVSTHHRLCSTPWNHTSSQRTQNYHKHGNERKETLNILINMIVCVHACVCACVYACECISLSTCISHFLFVRACMHACTLMCTCVHAYVHVCVCACVCVCVSAYKVHLWVCTHNHVHRRGCGWDMLLSDQTLTCCILHDTAQ